MRWWYLLSAVALGCAGASGIGGADAGGSADAAWSQADARLVDAASHGDAAAADAGPGADGAGADAEPGDPDAMTGDTDGGGVVAYAHTIVIDGVNDFVPADEQIATTTAGFTAYLAWDASYLYVGVDGADIGSGSPTRWVLVYLGGAGGTITGQTYNTQQPGLPFAARYHLGWRADNGYTQALEYSGSAWTPLAWDFTGDVYQSGTYLELRIPLADIGSPTSLPIHVSLINEQGDHEWTFAGSPAPSFTDGYDPDYGSYYELDLGGATVPSALLPK